MFKGSVTHGNGGVFKARLLDGLYYLEWSLILGHASPTASPVFRLDT